MNKQQVGVIGLAVMGKNLALNIVDHGFTVSVYNRSSQKTDNLIKEAEGKNIVGTYSLNEFVESLERPRRIILMVKAGEAVDDTIKELIPLLAKGDLIMDGGNSYYQDTMRRCIELNKQGLYYLGTGISGGEEGARNGPAIMPGGEKEAYLLMEPILTAISAKVEGEPCSTYIGDNGAGHFVKMVHNGIEYADMQLICEAYSIMKNSLQLSPPELAEVFSDWNKGELNSYLIDITADIFNKKDPDTGGYLVDYILDEAGQKGTGKWTGQIALQIGVPAPTITTAVYERYMSSLKEERENASKQLKGPSDIEVRAHDFTEAVRRALYASKICSYAQGFGMMQKASRQYGWNIKLKDVAKIFRGGCIIRAQFLNHIMSAYDDDESLENLLLADYFRDVVSQYQDEWREVIKLAVASGISIPGFSSALAYYDSYRCANLPMNLLQAQRDYFGAHTYRRTDKDGIYHTQW